MPETYLNSPRTTPVIPPAKPIHWTPIVIAAIAAGTIISITDIVHRPMPASVPVAAIAQSTPLLSPAPDPPTAASPILVPTPVAQEAAPVPRAELVEPIVRRGLPVEGNLYAITMPDGTHPLIRFMGSVESFDQLPQHPNLWDLYSVASSGHQWVFMQPGGFSAPAWVDP